MSVPQLNEEHRGEEILAVFDTAFGQLLAADPAAFRVKFRKMAASAFAFYRGTAGLFYRDLTEDPEFGDQPGGAYLDERTSRVWIHGDLHAENFGTYMDSTGRLIFNVNDFDEAYVGPFTWDLKRFAASVALIGYAKALSDEQITELVRVYAGAYRERIHALATGAKSDEVPPFTLDTAEGPLLGALRVARSLTRFGLLDSMTEIRDFERRFAPGGGSIELDAATRYKVLAAFDGYLETLPESSLTRPDSYRVKDVVGRRGIGIGSAGLPSYNILLEGNSDALENDVVIYIKQAQTPAVSRHITDQAIRDYFQHEGHRTVISSAPSRRTPTRGWAGPSWTARGSSSPRSRRTPSIWTGATSTTRRRSPRSSPTWAGPPRPCTRRPTTSPGSPWCRSPPSGPSTRRSRPTRRASRPCWSTSRTATAHARAATTRPSSTCSATAGSRACDHSGSITVGRLTGTL